MILSDHTILKERLDGNIIIESFNRDNLGPNSYDLTLAPTCKIYNPNAIGSRQDCYNKLQSDEKYRQFYNDYSRILDCRKDNPTYEFDIPEEGFVLQPNHLYLYACNETIGVKKDICATVMGKSSLGRLGLDIHICAGFIDTGFTGSLVLEMRTIYPLRIYPNMKICQIKFERVQGKICKPYDKQKGSKYHKQEGVVSSQMHKNFE